MTISILNFRLNHILCYIVIFATQKCLATNSTEVETMNKTYTLSFIPNEISVELHTTTVFKATISPHLNESVQIMLQEDNVGVVKVHPTVEFFPYNDFLQINISGLTAGHTVITGNVSNTSLSFNYDNAFINVQIYYSYGLDVFSTIIGWIYFFFWTVSFYPQIYENFKRKSVIGLNLDYLVLNILGHMSYNFFNIGLFWIPSVQAEYFKLHPHGVNPVQPNDIGFSMHAVFATTVTAIQACIYDRGDQKISITCRCLLAIFLTFLVLTLILSIVHVITWLDYLYYFSYVKLVITLIKCCPQAYLNYKRKSTVGWSIGNVLMDCVGGFLSILQMFIIAYNYNDWTSIFGDPTKFGLGLFSVLFDILFIIQHYILYRNTSNKLLEEGNSGDYESYTNDSMVVPS